ncbi:MAG: phage portal protein [Planctomycetaceae bacterium]|nr:phage portal protein [Planctomycetaceae bacterium]
MRTDGYEWIQGVKVGNQNQAFKYAIHRRGEQGGFTFEREVQAENMILVGYYTRADQIRGVSLMAPAINQFRDIYEGIDYALAKAKIAQLIGFATITDDVNEEDPDAAAQGRKSKVEAFDKGAIHFDLRPGEDVKLLTDTTPSNQFQSFIDSVIRVALAALDLPYQFWDSSATNFAGIRGAFDDYIDSCQRKQVGLIEALHEITDWRIRMAILDGELPPPPAGMSVDDVLWYCDWIGTRLPYYRILEDAKEMMIATQTGMLSPQKGAGMYGLDFDENLVEIAGALKTATNLNVPLPYAQTLNIGI